MLDKAVKLAINLHGNQFRRFSGKPYYTHVIEVAEYVALYKVSKNIDNILVAAILHDSIEDCDIDYISIEKEFGEMSAKLVLELTNDGNLIKKFGKKEYMANKVLNLTSYGLVIKLADRLHNIIDLKSAPDENFKIRYSDETYHIVEKLEDLRDLSDTHKKILTQIKILLK
jgi:GTP pyrophosphokinase